MKVFVISSRKALKDIFKLKDCFEVKGLYFQPTQVLNHPQRVIIFQPSFFYAVMALLSLAMLRFILFSHQSVLVLGTV